MHHIPGFRPRRRVAARAAAALASVAAAFFASGEAPAARPDTAAWNRALAAHQRAGGLDYAGLAADRADLDRFLASLAGVAPADLAPADRLAFWINAYNAVTAHFVLERYPTLASVKDVPGFFDRQTQPVAGRAMTLDQIESEARRLDPRVHFAVVCASTSCPDLAGEAFTGETVERQLKTATERFLADPTKGLRFDETAGKLYLSSIFKWYAGDFTGGSTVVAFFARGGLVDWILPRLADRRLAERIRSAEPAVEYLEYDWALNDRRQVNGRRDGSP